VLYFPQRKDDHGKLTIEALLNSLAKDIANSAEHQHHLPAFD
jgi:hypothetical protein